jgi:hypothetical protein
MNLQGGWWQDYVAATDRAYWRFRCGWELSIRGILGRFGEFVEPSLTLADRIATE